MQIPNTILLAMTGMLQPFWRDITPTGLAKLLAAGMKDAGAARREPMLTAQGAAQLLNVSVYTVWRMLKAGRLSGVRLNNGGWRVRTESVRDILEDRGNE